MADNPYQQFATPAAPANPYAKFSQAAGSSAPSTPPSLLGTVGDIPANVVKNTWEQIHGGIDLIGQGFKKGAITPDDPKKPSLLHNPVGGVTDVAAGAAQIAASPLTGVYNTAERPIRDYLMSKIPQNDPKTKAMVTAVANTMDDAVLLFGPEAFETVAPALKTATGPTRRLLDNGVQLTPGQISGKIAKRLEEAAKSVPILGSYIRGAEGRTFDSYNVATVNKALGDIGKTVTATDARGALMQAHDLADAQYAAVREGVPSLQKSPLFDRDIARLRLDLDEMDPTVKARVEAVIKNRIDSKWDSLTDSMDGAKFKAAESELTNIIKENKYSRDDASRQFAKGVERVRDALRSQVERQYPKVAERLKAVNKTYAKLADIDVAASASPTAQGRFTPGQHLAAIKRSDRSPRHMAFNEARTDMQRWSEDAHQVIGNKMPDSGTTERALWDLNLSKPGDWVGLFPSLAGAPLYSRAGSKALNSVAKGGPNPLAGLGGAIVGAAPIGEAASQAEGQP
jgi:hypothetical protein